MALDRRLLSSDPADRRVRPVDAAQSRRSRATTNGAGPEDAAPPRATDIVWWVFLAAVPSGLLIAVTAHIATDIAAVPLLWVLPLALYLVTFVIVFQTRPVIPHALVVKVQPVFILALAAAFVLGPIDSIIWSIALHLSVFFVCVLMCHGELARRRPPPRYLTGYYMWISVGGMIGGILTGLVAPHLFNWIAEYPILLLLRGAVPAGPVVAGAGKRTICAVRRARRRSADARCGAGVRPAAAMERALCAGRSPDRRDRALLAGTVAVRGHSRRPVSRQPVVPGKPDGPCRPQFLRCAERHRFVGRTISRAVAWQHESGHAEGSRRRRKSHQGPAGDDLRIL